MKIIFQVVKVEKTEFSGNLVHYILKNDKLAYPLSQKYQRSFMLEVEKAILAGNEVLVKGRAPVPYQKPGQGAKV